MVCCWPCSAREAKVAENRQWKGDGSYERSAANQPARGVTAMASLERRGASVKTTEQSTRFLLLVNYKIEERKREEISQVESNRVQFPKRRAINHSSNPTSNAYPKCEINTVEITSDNMPPPHIHWSSRLTTSSVVNYSSSSSAAASSACLVRSSHCLAASITAALRKSSTLPTACSASLSPCSTSCASC